MDVLLRPILAPGLLSFHIPWCFVGVMSGQRALDVVVAGQTGDGVALHMEGTGMHITLDQGMDPGMEQQLEDTY